MKKTKPKKDNKNPKMSYLGGGCMIVGHDPFPCDDQWWDSKKRKVSIVCIMNAHFTIKDIVGKNPTYNELITKLNETIGIKIVKDEIKS